MDLIIPMPLPYYLLTIISLATVTFLFAKMIYQPAVSPARRSALVEDWMDISKRLKTLIDIKDLTLASKDRTIKALKEIHDLQAKVITKQEKTISSLKPKA